MGGDDGLVPIWHNDIFNHHNEAGWLLHVVSVHIYWLMFVYWNCNAFYLTLAKLSVSKNRLSFATVTINNVTSFKLIWKSPMYMSWFGNFFCFIFVRGIDRSLVDCSYKGPVTSALMSCLMSHWTRYWTNSWVVCDLRRLHVMSR